jgi:hypothetical protein
MSNPDYDIHLDRDQFNSLFDDDGESGFPYGEDLDDIERAIAEELGPSKPRKKRKNPKK